MLTAKDGTLVTNAIEVAGTGTLTFPADRNGVMPWWKGTVDLHEGDLEIVWGANFGSHVFQLAAPEVPVGLDVSERPVAIMASVGDVWFSVRGGEPFNVMVCG